MNTLVREDRDNELRQNEHFVAPVASIIGRRSRPTVEDTLIHRESRRENYRRAFELDPSIDADKISAKIDQGVVTLNSA
jgi:HSP20 family molecular chaperone IbpA